MKKSIAILLACLLIVCFSLTALLSGCGSDPNINAWVVAEDQVKSKLKSPSTAQFPSYSDTFVTKSGDTYYVSAYVDAENSFGGTIRNNWYVQLKDAGNGQFQVVSVSVS